MAWDLEEESTGNIHQTNKPVADIIKLLPAYLFGRKEQILSLRVLYCKSFV